MKWRLLPYLAADPAWNMAVDEAIFAFYCRDNTRPTLRFYGWNSPALSLGYFQDASREVNLPELEARGFRLIRRATGGRAVLHHHELTYSVVAGVRDGLPDTLTESYLYISRALCDGLNRFGVTATLHRENENPVSSLRSGACFDSPSVFELTVNGRKLVGSAQFRNQQAFLQHGSILLDFSAADLSYLLYKSTKSRLTLDDYVSYLESKMTSLRHLRYDLPPEVLATAVTESFQKLYDITFETGVLSPEETELAQQLVHDKYGNDSWIFSRGSTKDSTRVNSLSSSLIRDERHS